MRQLTEQEIIDNWNKFYSIIKDTFTGTRKEALLKIADTFQDRMMLAPAAYKEHYHGSYPGGYIVQARRSLSTVLRRFCSLIVCCNTVQEKCMP